VIAETEKLDGNKRDHVPASWGPLSSIVTERMHFIRNGNATFELYDLAADSGETRNLASAPEWCESAAALDMTLRRLAAKPSTPAFDTVKCRAGNGRDVAGGSAR
jgi:hypothetical protein